MEVWSLGLRIVSISKQGLKGKGDLKFTLARLLLLTYCAKL